MVSSGSGRPWVIDCLNNGSTASCSKRYAIAHQFIYVYVSEVSNGHSNWLWDSAKSSKSPFSLKTAWNRQFLKFWDRFFFSKFYSKEIFHLLQFVDQSWDWHFVLQLNPCFSEEYLGKIPVLVCMYTGQYTCVCVGPGRVVLLLEQGIFTSLG